MPVWILAMGSTVGAVLVKMAAQLVTESFLKRAILTALEAAAAKSETKADDELVAAARVAWFGEG